MSPSDYGEAQRRCIEAYGCGCPLCVCRMLGYPVEWEQPASKEQRTNRWHSPAGRGGREGVGNS